MQLREHNSRSGQLFCQWSSGWGGSFGPNTKFPIGEVGTLTNVQFHQAQGSMPRHLTLHMEYEGTQFSTVLTPKDDEFMDRLYPTLQGCIGKPMHEVGSVEI